MHGEHRRDVSVKLQAGLSDFNDLPMNVQRAHCVSAPLACQRLSVEFKAWLTG